MGTGIMVTEDHKIVVDSSEQQTLMVDDRIKHLDISVLPQASLQLIVTFDNSQSEKSLNTTIRVQDGGSLEFIVIQNDSGAIERQDTIHVTLEKKSTFNGVWLVNPGKSSNRQITVEFKGSDINAQLNGIAIVSGQSQVSTVTKLIHHEPHTDAAQFFKSVIGGEGQSSFNGLVYVKAEAQQTNSNQYNHNLLLSDSARALSQPQLEIFADDVKCSHGATIGQLDEEHIFYLNARGLSKDMAKQVLLEGFAEDIIDKISVESCRESCKALFLDQLKGLA